MLTRISAALVSIAVFMTVEAIAQSAFVPEASAPIAGSSLEKRFAISKGAMVPAGTPCKMYPGAKAEFVRAIDGDKVIVRVQTLTTAQFRKFFDNAKKRVTEGLSDADRQCISLNIVAKKDWDMMLAASPPVIVLPVPKKK